MSRKDALRSFLLAVALGSLGAAIPAHASDVTAARITISSGAAGGQASPGRSQGGGTWQVRAFVPVACWVRAESAVLAVEGQTGSVVEACNNPGGFTVFATYRPLKASEQAQLVYDDQSVNLSSAGSQLLRRSSVATIKRVNYQFRSLVLEEPLVLSLTIQPI